MPALDTLKFAEYLRKSGVPTAQADAIADGFNKQVEDHVLTEFATKQDLATSLEKLEARLNATIAKDLAAVKNDLHREITTVRTDLTKEITTLEMRMTTKLFASQIGIAGLIVALMKFV